MVSSSSIVTAIPSDGAQAAAAAKGGTDPRAGAKRETQGRPGSGLKATRTQRTKVRDVCGSRVTAWVSCLEQKNNERAREEKKVADRRKVDKGSRVQSSAEEEEESRVT